MYRHLFDNIVFKTIAQVADENQIACYAIGGFVRDAILNRPLKDADFVVVGDGLAFAEKVANRLNKPPKVSLFKNFGTAMFHYQGMDYEFVGARKESYQRDSRKPEVEPGTIEDDQNRRDFTINALAISMNKTDFGQLVDPFNGIGDLEKGLIKTPLDADITFSDDPLRMMRAIRFATQLQFSIAPETLQAIERNRERISIISQERITDELNKIISAKNPSIGFNILFNTGLLHLTFPEMAALHGVETKDNISHKDNFYHTLKVLDNVCETSDNIWLRWAAILHDIAKPKTKKFYKKQGWTFHGHEFAGAKMVAPIFRRMKLPLDANMKFVEKMVLLHLRPIALSKENITDSAIRRLIFDAGDDIDDLMKLCKADITSKNKQKVRRYLENFELVEEKILQIEAKDHIRNFQPPIDGEEIMQIFQIKPSPIIGIIKTKIKDAILDGDIENNREQAYALMLKIAEAQGLKPA